MTDDGRIDLELMHRARRGDREAFAQIVRRHQKPLVNYFRRMGAHTDEADDLAQETFLRVYSYRKRWKPTGKFTSFLYVLARHAWADLLRKSSRTPTPVDPATQHGELPDSAPRSDARIDMDAALATLSEKLRSVVVLNVYQGMKYQEVAEVLDIPVGTVKSRMHLAMQQLREQFHVDE
jgi:RNA polymerase sigma-70 factor (ECF subfamily)